MFISNENLNEAIVEVLVKERVLAIQDYWDYNSETHYTTDEYVTEKNTYYINDVIVDEDLNVIDPKVLDDRVTSLIEGELISYEIMDVL